MNGLVIPVEDSYVSATASIVKQGGLVVYPTETVYGLGCDPFNQKAVREVFKVKGRVDRPLPILVANLKKALEMAYFSTPALKIAKKHWPGPLTLVLKRRETSPSFLGGDPTLIGLRVSSHPVATRLAKLCGGSIVGTSANLSGKKPPTTADEALEQIGGKVDLILDGGKTKFGLSSTVLDLSMDEPKILRIGPIGESELLKSVKNCKR